MAERPPSLLGAVAATVAYFAVFVPLGVILAPFWRRRLRLGISRGADSYWVARTMRGSWRDSLREQR
ncbi:MAG TPA: hypothetical protein VMB84_06710 [Stellaceae bacterium]|nr:hypothetical protein [Stellaceae bacterium]